MDTKLSGEHWKKIIGLPEDKGIIDKSRVPETESQYIILSNFGVVFDEVIDKVTNPPSGISEEAFTALVQDYCQRFDLEVIEDLGDTYVITGNQDAYVAVSLEMDRRFSHAYTDQTGYDAMMEAEENYAFEVAMGIHVPSEKRGISQPMPFLDS